jgi:ABC-type branched-subunit amino acid transport system substrate-binding protein
MAEFKNTGRGGSTPGASPSDEMVTKVGKAVGQIAEIREECQERLTRAATDDEKQALAQRAEQAAVKAIREQGLSVDQYNQVVAAADNDPDLEERLLAAAEAEW